MPFPLVLKIPDGSFSRGVVKVEDPDQLRVHAATLFEKSALILAQEFLYTDFDWRIGILNRRPIFACQYFMSKNHWQIYKHNASGSVSSGPPPRVSPACRLNNCVSSPNVDFVERSASSM